ncbi:uncharacterized protein KIAA1257 homolog [Cricetulus griseus]|uniref:Uncharacterized protein KIAA1257 homolog n=1 Tax=Cricetulus griseus TaxID=10029 RepID=A0A9J7K014_CRIGR|nr:uncharacterized protein KIAA1257 homolog [Cricetulus griseus]XP_027293198.1 uncharacterized protein KIAA1257 homolog [Cricetulus griseus]
MSLKAWEWEEDGRASMEPASSMASAYQSASEYETDEYPKSRTPAQEWDSEDQFSSLESSEGPPCSFNTDVPQVVPCRFVISLAFPVQSGQKGKASNLSDKKKTPKPDNRAAKTRQFYHIEYFFLPDDVEPKKVDVVLFPGVAKVFLESGIKTVKPWREDDKIWVSWSQTFNVNMTKELLKKINFHKITLKLWDTRDKVSKKVRYHRLKTATFLEDPESFEEVKFLVLSQKRLSTVANEKPNIFPEELKEENIPGDQEKHIKSSQEAEIAKNGEECEKSIKMEDPSVPRRTPTKTPISLTGTTMMEIKEIIEKASLSSLTNLLEKQKSQIKGKDSETKKKAPKKMKKYQTEEEAEPKLAAASWKPSVFSIQLSIMPLLAGWQTVISRGSEKSANILDCFLTLKTEVPIMTEEQKQDLNPLTIKVRCASCLPVYPVSIRELERLCAPVYCRYQFHTTPVHETKGEPHGTHVFFQDINVIFLGAMHPSDLREYLEGPPMVVEVHDRDRKSEQYSRKPTLFGEDFVDSYFNLQAFISPKDTENNPFESQNKMWDPYGIARVSFAELLLGHKYLNLVVPIHNCEPKFASQSQDSRKRSVGYRTPAEVLQHNSMPIGNYLEANSLLKLRVDIAVPLSSWFTAPELDLMGTQFGRIIFVFNTKKLALLQDLLKDITKINAKALGLDNYPIQKMQQILSAFRVRVKIQEQQNLDVLTGFHLLDGRIHLFILEGLAEHGLRQLWESYQSRVTTSNRVACKVLYDSRLLFRHRLYADLETILYHVHLFRPVSLLLRYPVLYIRGAVSRMAFKALARIHDICHNSTRLKEVIMRDLLPSSSMIKDLNQEFGMPISQEELINGKMLTVSPQSPPNEENIQRQTSTLPEEIQIHQEKYLQWRNNMLRNQVHKCSLVQKNITEAYQLTKKPLKSMVKAIRIAIPENKAVHNYSIQSLNSTELAKKEMFKEMAKEPWKRFTYSQKYLSAMVDPNDPEEEAKKAQKKSRQAWLTASGFQTWGLQSSIGCYQQDFGLPPVKELNEEWQENSLFTGLLKPVLDRDRWSWSQRHLDFDLYKKPPLYLQVPSLPPPKPAIGRKQKASIQSSEWRRQSRVTTKSPSSCDSLSVHLQDIISLNDHHLALGTQSHITSTPHESSVGPHHPSSSFPSRWLH